MFLRPYGALATGTTGRPRMSAPRPELLVDGIGFISFKPLIAARYTAPCESRRWDMGSRFRHTKGQIRTLYASS